MGHDIEIGNIAVTGVTSNFNFSDYCTIHQWHGHKGSVVAKIIKRTLAKMDKNQIKIGTRDHSNPSWPWGVNKDNSSMSDSNKLSVYRYYLENEYLKLAEKFPNEVWLSDQVWCITSIEELKENGFVSSIC